MLDGIELLQLMLCEMVYVMTTMMMVVEMFHPTLRIGMFQTMTELLQLMRAELLQLTIADLLQLMIVELLNLTARTELFHQ
jgi:hypothetical protein